MVRYVTTCNAPVLEEILLLHFDYPLNVLHNGRARVEDIDCKALLFQFQAALHEPNLGKRQRPPEFRFQSAALGALQEASEAYLAVSF